MITYEYPLNERIRTLLRLESLFERANHFLVKEEDSRDHHAALLTLFEILEVATRADLKSDLLQELERQKQVLVGFRNNPQIAENVLKQVISDIERTSAALFAMTGKIGQHLRENDWLMSIKQRTGIPGGACEFDLPSYHYWLHRQAEERTGQLAAWTACWWSTPRRKRRSRAYARAAGCRKARYRRSCARRRPAPNVSRPPTTSSTTAARLTRCGNRSPHCMFGTRK